jgi:uncharacterized membrane protein YphA (DoxX/SURF4 family)
MNSLIWALQLILAVGFGASGVMKLAKTKAWLQANKQDWVDGFSQRTIKIVAALEVAGAIGLILPWALDILPILTPLAASGLGVTMVCAAVVHGRRKEFTLLALNIALLVLTIVVAWTRFGDLFAR